MPWSSIRWLGGGTVIDVCESMGRRCLAYDIHSIRPDVQIRDVNSGFPPETSGCDLVFCDPPYHYDAARRYGAEGGDGSARRLDRLLNQLAQRVRHDPTRRLPRPLGGQPDRKDLPAGRGYLDHAFFGYAAIVAAGFLPERRISCPMDGTYLPSMSAARDRGADAWAGTRSADCA